MKTGVKIAIGVASVLGLTAIFVAIASKAKAKAPETGGNAKEILSSGSAIPDQFDEVYKIAQATGSNMFASMTGDQLQKANSTFTANLTYRDATSLISLLNKPSASWSASEKILFDTLTKKWKGPESPKVVVPNVPAIVLASTTSPSYDVLADSDYDAKVSVLDVWRNDLLQKQKGGFLGIFQKNVPDKNDFNKKFLPISLSDIKQYSSLQMKKDRNVKEDTIMGNVRAKYPNIFKGIQNKIYSITGEIANDNLKTDY